MENRSHCPASADVSEVSDFMTCAWERLQPGMSAGIINTERTGDVYSFAATSHHGSSARGFTVREEREELDRGHYTETRRWIRASTHGLPNDESLVVSHFGKTMELAVHTGDKREREIAREFDRRFLRPPTDAEITNLEIQASMALRREQWVSALRVGHLILKHQPQNVDALLAVGIASGAQGDAITSELALCEVLELKPSHADALYNLAQLRRTQDDKAAALSLYQRAVSADPANHPIHFQLGTLLEELGRLPEARAAYEKTVTLSPNPKGAWGYSGMDFTEAATRALSRLSG